MSFEKAFKIKVLYSRNWVDKIKYKNQKLKREASKKF